MYNRRGLLGRIKPVQLNMLVDTSLYVQELLPDTYEVKIIEDLVPNGEWDSGNYLQKFQPERQVVQKFEPLRENWTLELTLDISSLFKE